MQNSITARPIKITLTGLSKKAGLVLSWIGFTALLAGCISLPNKKTDNSRVPPADLFSTEMAKLFAPSSYRTTGNSGNYLLRDGHQALADRLYLIELAEKQIDVQYFLWNSDRSGALFLQKLMQAAERGVYVRILIDGFSIADRNKQIAHIDQHPNVDVRIYNPFTAQTGFGRAMNLLFDFDRLNHRMHNKALVIDGTVAITGGRNIGDAYFGYDNSVNFIDADVLSVGPVVHDISKSFQDYWDSRLSIPSLQLVKDLKIDEAEDMDLRQFIATDQSAFLNRPLLTDKADIKAYLQQLKTKLIWAETHFVADDPKKAAKRRKRVKEVAATVGKYIEASNKNVLIESAYVVLDDTALAFLTQLEQKGTRVQVLTNSLASNNLLPNHAGYAKVRKSLIESGVELYELKPKSGRCDEQDDKCNDPAALHAKTAVFDEQTVYVGSLNFNLRSAYLNTESGLFIDSAIMAKELSKQIKSRMNLHSAWQPIILGEDLLWITFDNGQISQSRTEPYTTTLERVEVDLLTVIPGTEYF